MAIRKEMNEQLERLIRFIKEPRWDAAPSDEAFADLALRSFWLQCQAIPAYGAYARHVGRAPEQVRDWRDIPPAPASAFKTHDLSAAPEGAGILFETSGTTISQPGRVRLSSTDLYETSLLENFAEHLLPDGAMLDAVVFGPTRAAAPHSSLWFMVDRVVSFFCGGAAWGVAGGEPNWDWLDAALEQASAEGEPVLLLGTTLLLHAYFERCDRRGIRFPLPRGSRAMDTGGAKGIRIALERAAIEADFARVLGISATHLVNEYGMAEMGSQFYDDSYLATHERRAIRPGKRIPPWVRTRVLDPETMGEVADGVSGVLVHYDLANLEIPLAIQTEDLGARQGDRLLIEGRLPEAERRGCSLPFERFAERERMGSG